MGSFLLYTESDSFQPAVEKMCNYRLILVLILSLILKTKICFSFCIRDFPALRHNIIFKSSIMFSGSGKREYILNEVRELRASHIKSELKRRNIDTSGIFEKEQLVELLSNCRLSEETANIMNASQVAGSSLKIPLRVLRGSLGMPKNYICCTAMLSNNKEEFIIDTGSSNCIITEQLRTKLGLEPIKGVTTTGAGGGGSVWNVPVVQVRNAVIGGQLCNLQCLVLPNNRLPPGISGLIGIDFVKNFRVADFNFEENELFLHNSEAALFQTVSQRKMKKVPLMPHPLGFVCCAVDVNGKCTYAALVDMGSTFSIINKAGAQQAGISNRDQGYKKNVALMAGVDGSPMAVDLALVDTVQVGGPLGLKLSQTSLHIGDVPGMSLAGFGAGPAGLLGLDVLGKRRSMFDFQEMCMYLGNQET